MNFFIDNWQAILSGGTGVVGGISGFFLGRKGRMARTMQEQGAAMELMQKAYDSFVSDSKAQYEGVKSELQELRSKVHGYEQQISTLKEEILQYKVKVGEYELEVERLKGELSKYKTKKQ
ncbi:hypothetical protein LL912_00925 [Niabella sp. CC-SYL272]|uniref:hypothetical protein n=1 Tax=Niabella agricola TaxID=2891571 RepID=UPI001F3D4F50|nr:hypothetical protein [Niabella agricola]MCF3107330.1 hypothetical protein [Niabella agricola]